ncbi:MAG: hypothetical protein BGN88_04600 [Clostridiales bacterium 43-6]|nr:MAG: hypothetical protein BGN88_04600 [Clostridiales bacterium 43-6]
MKTTVSGAPYFMETNPVPSQFPWLDRSAFCDVAIIGGGVSGAMAAYKFTKMGVKVALLSESPVGYCTTAASQGVASVSLTGGLSGLIANIGTDMAPKVYGECEAAVNILENIINELVPPVPYKRKDSVIYSEDDANAFSEEYQALHHNNFPAELYHETDARQKFSFPVKSALLIPNGAIECDPYLLTHSLCQNAAAAGAQIFENTMITEIVENENEEYVLYSDFGKTVTAKKVVIAAGLETARQLETETQEKVTYSLVTRPVSDFTGWWEEATLCKTGCDNIRLRTTPDRRIIISGLDCGIAGLKSGIISPEKMADKKYAALHTQLMQMFPNIKNIEAEYNYFNEYAFTELNLPIVGESEGIYYDLVPAENGIVFSIIAADMLIAKYFGNENDETALFEEQLYFENISNKA